MGRAMVDCGQRLSVGRNRGVYNPNLDTGTILDDEETQA